VIYRRDRQNGSESLLNADDCDTMAETSDACGWSYSYTIAWCGVRFESTPERRGRPVVRAAI